MVKRKGKKRKVSQKTPHERKGKESIASSGYSNSAVVSWIIFLFTISIVLISFVPVLFPAFLVSGTIPNVPNVPYVGPDIFETGPWAVPVVLTNITIFGFAILIWKEKLFPRSLTNWMYRLFVFEVSRKVTFVTILVLLTLYIAPTTQEILQTESWEDYKGIKKRLDIWPQQAVPTEPHVKYFFLKSSEEIFGNDRIVPFLTSISLLILTYFTTKMITQKRFAGIVSLVIVLQSHVFLAYDTTVSYTNFWILFYLLSLYLLYRKMAWILSPASYLASISAKSMTIMFLPMLIYFILRSEKRMISRKKQLITIGVVTVIVLAGISAFLLSGQSGGGEATTEPFSAKEFWMGFTSFAMQLRFDGLVLLFMIPLIIGLFIASRSNIKHAESIMVLISGMLLVPPILTGFTDQTNQPYRFVPLIVFFAIGVGTLLSKRRISQNGEAR